MPSRVAFKCAACGHPHDLVGTLAPETACSRCDAPLHSCTNCTFFDSGARFECRKPISERVESKSKANECRYFQPRTVRDLRPPDSKAAATGKSAFDALFKKG
jgi:predicted nucleic acid-binding Zn ribbon protein